MTFESRWAELEPIGRAGTGGYRRFAWTAEDAALREWFAGSARALGLDLTLDRAGAKPSARRASTAHSAETTPSGPS